MYAAGRTEAETSPRAARQMIDWKSFCFALAQNIFSHNSFAIQVRVSSRDLFTFAHAISNSTHFNESHFEWFCLLLLRTNWFNFKCFESNDNKVKRLRAFILQSVSSTRKQLPGLCCCRFSAILVCLKLSRALYCERTRGRTNEIYTREVSRR